MHGFLITPHHTKEASRILVENAVLVAPPPAAAAAVVFVAVVAVAVAAAVGVIVSSLKRVR